MCQNKRAWWYKLFNWISSWSNPLQVLVNATLAVLTLLTLCYTIHFSNENLAQSTAQFNLAKEQFDSTKAKWFQEASDKIKHDSIERSRYNRQEKRNGIQDSINKRQLIAFQNLERTTQLQYDAQNRANKETEYQSRAIFALKGISFDSLNNWGIITINNAGRRAPKIIATDLCSYSRITGFQRNYQKNDDIDFNESASVGIKVRSTKQSFYDKSTMFYLSVDYIDSFNHSKKSFTKYFYWYYNTNNVLTWSRLEDSEISLFIQIAKSNNVILKSSH